MGTTTIRAARSEEFEAVGELTARAYVQGGHIDPDDQHYLPLLRDAAGRAETAQVLVAVEDEAVLGTVTVARYGSAYTGLAELGEMSFRMLAVDPAVGGQGVGRALVEAVIASGRAEGFRRIVLRSVESMAIAHRLYRSLGFARTPERDGQIRPDLRLLAFCLELDQSTAPDVP